MGYLKQHWNQLTSGLPDIREDYFGVFVRCYSEASRYYHTLDHVEALLLYIDRYADELSEVETLRWGALYHDIIYDAEQQDNEEQSAELAKDHLGAMNVDTTTVKRVSELIVATKTHEANEADFDLCFFLDIDLSILATDWAVYEQYTRDIRQEYIVYPDELYREGRKKVLEHFLQMKRIYKTTLLQDQWEVQAHLNLQRELAVLPNG